MNSAEVIRLFNAGERAIEYAAGCFFRPGTSIDFPLEVGKKLHRLYKDEVRTPEDHLVPYESKPFGEQEEEIKKIKAEAEKAASIAAKDIEAEKAKLAADKEAFEAEKAAFEAAKIEAVAGKKDESASGSGNRNRKTS